LPSGARLTRGGHRGLEVFITQPAFVSRVDRETAVQEIKNRPEWRPYGVVLPVLADDIIAQVEKVIENIAKLKGSNAKKAAIIKNGCPKAYRLSWFVKDPIQGEFYNTVQEAIEKGPSKKKEKHRKALVGSLPIITIPKAPTPAVPQFDKYSLINFVTDIHGLIASKEQYIAVIKRMEDKINREYPVLISMKEAEKAAAEKEVEILKDRVKVLSRTCEEQKTEIYNLKRHPKFAGFVEKKK
jgi:hypothetical protein